MFSVPKARLCFQINRLSAYLLNQVINTQLIITRGWTSRSLVLPGRSENKKTLRSSAGAIFQLLLAICHYCTDGHFSQAHYPVAVAAERCFGVLQPFRCVISHCFLRRFSLELPPSAEPLAQHADFSGQPTQLENLQDFCVMSYDSFELLIIYWLVERNSLAYYPPDRCTVTSCCSEHFLTANERGCFSREWAYPVPGITAPIFLKTSVSSPDNLFTQGSPLKGITGGTRFLNHFFQTFQTFCLLIHLATPNFTELHRSCRPSRKKNHTSASPSRRGHCSEFCRSSPRNTRVRALVGHPRSRAVSPHLNEKPRKPQPQTCDVTHSLVFRRSVRSKVTQRTDELARRVRRAS